ncbi:MAG: DUF5330 domain-containing protein [Pseudomonadota bacterium]
MLFKPAFLILAGLVALPSLAPDHIRDETQPISAVDAEGVPYQTSGSGFKFATGVVADIAGLCTRSPEICAYGIKTADAVILRAQHGFRIAYATVIEHRERINGADADAPR